MHHLDAQESLANFAEQAQFQLFFPRPFELPDLTAIKIEETQRQFATAIRDLRDELAPRAEQKSDLHNVRFQLHRRAVRGGSDGKQLRFVLIAQRQMQHEIALARQPELPQACSERGRHFGRIGAHVGVQRETLMIASISTNAPRGRAATPITARAGYGSAKYCGMISLSLAKWVRSVR